MKKFFNRDVLKIIGCVCMLIDHVGYVFFPEVIVLRIIGRLAFPIFAFFIAEGFIHTRNKYKYLLLLCGFAIVSQIPYGLIVNNFFKLNILFTFSFSVVMMILLDRINTNDKKDRFINVFAIVIVSVVVIFLDVLTVVDYGVLGVLTPIVLYVFKNKKAWKWCGFSLMLVLFALMKIVYSLNFSFNNFIQFFSLLSLPLLLIYNGEKGNVHFKYVFYLFYPFHLLIIYIFSLFL